MMVGTGRPQRDPLLDESNRRMAATTVAAAAIAWWPAFTLGTYGVVFFEQLLTLWVAATSVLLVAAATQRSRVLRRLEWWALSVPSVWLLVALILPPGGTSFSNQLLFWFGVALSALGIPAMAAVLVRLVLPGAQRLDASQRWVAVAVVALVIAASFTLGALNPRLLTCDDFTISGNFAPSECTPGRGTTEL